MVRGNRRIVGLFALLLLPGVGAAHGAELQVEQGRLVTTGIGAIDNEVHLDQPLMIFQVQRPLVLTGHPFYPGRVVSRNSAWIAELDPATGEFLDPPGLPPQFTGLHHLVAEDLAGLSTSAKGPNFGLWTDLPSGTTRWAVVFNRVNGTAPELNVAWTRYLGDQPDLDVDGRFQFDEEVIPNIGARPRGNPLGSQDPSTNSMAITFQTTGGPGWIEVGTGPGDPDAHREERFPGGETQGPFTTVLPYDLLGAGGFRWMTGPPAQMILTTITDDDPLSGRLEAGEIQLTRVREVPAAPYPSQGDDGFTRVLTVDDAVIKQDPYAWYAPELGPAMTPENTAILAWTDAGLSGETTGFESQLARDIRVWFPDPDDEEGPYRQRRTIRPPVESVPTRKANPGPATCETEPRVETPPGHKYFQSPEPFTIGDTSFVITTIKNEATGVSDLALQDTTEVWIFALNGWRQRLSDPEERARYSEVEAWETEPSAQGPGEVLFYSGKFPACDNNLIELHRHSMGLAADGRLMILDDFADGDLDARYGLLDDWSLSGASMVNGRLEVAPGGSAVLEAWPTIYLRDIELELHATADAETRLRVEAIAEDPFETRSRFDLDLPGDGSSPVTEPLVLSHPSHPGVSGDQLAGRRALRIVLSVPAGAAPVYVDDLALYADFDDDLALVDPFDDYFFGLLDDNEEEVGVDPALQGDARTAIGARVEIEPGDGTDGAMVLRGPGAAVEYSFARNSLGPEDFSLSMQVRESLQGADCAVVSVADQAAPTGWVEIDRLCVGDAAMERAWVLDRLPPAAFSGATVDLRLELDGADPDSEFQIDDLMAGGLALHWLLSDDFDGLQSGDAPAFVSRGVLLPVGDGRVDCVEAAVGNPVECEQTSDDTLFLPRVEASPRNAVSSPNALNFAVAGKTGPGVAPEGYVTYRFPRPGDMVSGAVRFDLFLERQPQGTGALHVDVSSDGTTFREIGRKQIERFADFSGYLSFEIDAPVFDGEFLYVRLRGGIGSAAGSDAGLDAFIDNLRIMASSDPSAAGSNDDPSIAQPRGRAIVPSSEPRSLGLREGL